MILLTYMKESLGCCAENRLGAKDGSKETVKGLLQNPDELRWGSDPVEIL